MAKKSVNKSSKPLKKPKKSPAASNVIEVPKPAPGSYDPSRPLSKNTLLLHQVRHFQQVEQSLPESERTGHDPASITTEGQAADYLRKMTAKLHPQGAVASEASKTLAKKGANG